jgi:DNA mismatch repair ATPase MutS
MSGKTYFLKALIFGILCGLATGYAPAKKAAMPLFEALVYLDRVTAKNDRNLSAYANELTFWIKIFKLILEGKSILSAVDEAFSTTSPRYQSALTYAVVMSMLALGKYLAIASHNHDALDALEKINPQHIKAYHFDTHFDEKGEIQFDYKMAPGHELSQAIAVAKKLGLPQEIIDIALSL